MTVNVASHQLAWPRWPAAIAGLFNFAAAATAAAVTFNVCVNSKFLLDELAASSLNVQRKEQR
jgi:hypothetical protein